MCCTGRVEESKGLARPKQAAPRQARARAVTVAAHQVARLVYAVRTQGKECIERGQDYYWERHHMRVLHELTQRAKAMDMQLVPTETPS